MEMGTEDLRTNLIINHLPHNLTDVEFEKIFSEVGVIKSYRIMKDLQTGTSFGFGFVEYHKPDDSARAILKLNNYEIQHKRLKVSYAQPADGGDIKDTNLYIQNLPKTYTVDKLEVLFSPYGKITERLVYKDKITGLPKGIAFVKFQNRSEAFAAIEGLNGQIPEEGTDPLLVKIAKDGTNKKNSAFQAGYIAGLAGGGGGGGGGRGRAQYNNRGGFVRGNYTDMEEDLTYGSLTDFTSDYQQGGKIGLDRSNNRYNPIGTGGGYSTASSYGMAYGGVAVRETAPTQFARVSSVGNPGASYASLARPGAYGVHY